MKRFWLMKTEPEDFSIEDLKKKGREPWSGVRNFQARNFMLNEMKVGDGVLFYHSSTEVPGVYGLAKVATDSYPDPTQFDKKSKYYDEKSKRENPRWYLVDVEFDKVLKYPVTLDRLRAEPELADMIALKKGNRLSITPVTKPEFDRIVQLGNKKP
jgi:predicted RNA-binding protein with PUA-like domain